MCAHSAGHTLVLFLSVEGACYFQFMAFFGEAIILMATELQVRAKPSATQLRLRYQPSHLSAQPKTRAIVILSAHAYSRPSNLI